MNYLNNSKFLAKLNFVDFFSDLNSDYEELKNFYKMEQQQIYNYIDILNNHNDNSLTQLYYNFVAVFEREEINKTINSVRIAKKINKI